MAIDPLRHASPHLLTRVERGTEPRRSTIPAAASSPETAVEATTPAEPRRGLVLARIQSDYYSQSHIRERVIESLLEFLGEE